MNSAIFHFDSTFICLYYPYLCWITADCSSRDCGVAFLKHATCQTYINSLYLAVRQMWPQSRRSPGGEDTGIVTVCGFDNAPVRILKIMSGAAYSDLFCPPMKSSLHFSSRWSCYLGFSQAFIESLLLLPPCRCKRFELIVLVLLFFSPDLDKADLLPFCTLIISTAIQSGSNYHGGR